MKTIKQIFDTIIGNNSMLPIDLSVEKFPFIDNYKENQTAIDTWFKRNFGDFYVYFEPENYTEWIGMMNETLSINQPNIVHLWNITQQNYVPIENVEENTSTITERNSYTDTDSYGERTDVDNVGTNGKTGNTTSTQKDYSVPNDSDVQKEIAKNDNSVTNEELETTTTKGAQSDDHIHGAQMETITIKRHGNIGVTSNTELLTQENEFWQNFNFYRALFHLIKRDWLMGVL